MGKVFKALTKANESQTDTEGQPENVSSQRKNEERTPNRPAYGKAVHHNFPVGWEERLTLATSITGPGSENFRTLRTRILHPSEGKVPRSILVTSTIPGEGKSFVCANLGFSLAQVINQHCLIVDCDLRNPSLHNLFGLPNRRGLVDHLRDGDELNGLVTNCGLEKLTLLPAGTPPVNPSELLGSEAMVSLVDELVTRYDDRIILIDSPPLHLASETAVLAKQVDGVVLVVRWGVSRREHVREMVEIIGRDCILGVVFNAYKENIFDARVFGSYQFSYAYKYGKV